jgi:serine/threonine-protein kinase TTK/MPS1
MSPEAIELPDGMRRLKVGRPSDVWSLGCILYQMVYGHPPFQHLSVYQKMKAIPDISHVIDFPEYSVPSIPAKPIPTGQPQQPKRLEHLKKRVPKGVIDSMKNCLCRTSKERATIPQLLEQEWMVGPTEEKEKPKNDIGEFLGPQETVINPYYMRQLLEYGMSMGRNQGNLDPEAMLKEAEVCGLFCSWYICGAHLYVSSAW